MTETVTLRTENSQSSVPMGDIYFTFGDGRLSYDCESCGAACCRGHGYNVRVGAQATQLAIAPAMVWFLSKCDDHSDHCHVSNFKPGCFFLNAEGKCRIHEQHGVANKPSTCRLFPFNRFCLVGDHLVVSPHPSLCPLVITSTNCPSTLSDHGMLRQIMRECGIDGHIYSPAHRCGDPRAFVAAERAIVELAELSIAAGDSFLEFLDKHESINNLDVQNARHNDNHRLLEVLAAVLGCPHVLDREAASFESTMIACTPTLRVDLVLRPTRKGLTPGPYLAPSRVPGALLAVYVLARLARDAGMTRITYQTVSQLFGEYQGLINLLAHINCVAVLRQTVPLDLKYSGDTSQRAKYATLLKRLLPQSQETSPRTLYELLLDTLPAAGLDRITMLKTLASRLVGRLHPLGEQPETHERTRPRARLERWALRHVQAELLASSPLMRSQ